MSTPPAGRGEGRRDPDTGGRPLADILREAGVDSPTRGRRRRGDELEDTGVRQRGTGDTGRVADRAEFGRRATDRTGGAPTPGPERRSGRKPFEPSTAAIPGLRPSRKPGVPGAPSSGATSSGATSSGATSSGATSSGATSSGATSSGGTASPGTPQAGSGRDGRAGAAPRERRPRAGTAAAGADPAPRTGPIPVVRADDPPLLEDDGLAPREGVMAWLRFGGELVLALAAGVGIYFLFTVLWQQLPYLAVLLAPVAVAGLVGGVGAWRQRQDREPVGARLVAILVFAGTMLTIAPAAGLLATG